MELSKASSWPQQAKSYMDEVKAEMRRVSWPSWKQVRATTAVVIASVFAFSLYFFVVDAVIGRGITKLFEALTR